jgi:hypothetical protein
MPRWSDDPTTSNTRIRVAHIGELRRTIDFYRARAGLPTMTWTDNPVSTTIHFRWIHFTELRSAVQDLWMHAGLGTLPTWSVGSAPSSNRQTSARDINDLRVWVNTVDPPLTIWTGFHWCSPVVNASSDTAKVLFQSSGRWGAVIIVGASPGGTDTSFTYACDRVMDAREANQGGRSLDQCVARIYYQPTGQPPPPNPTISEIGNVQMADSWLSSNGYYSSLDYFVVNGGRNIVLFNELNVTTEPQHNADPRVMGYFSYALKQHFLATRGAQVSALFPGPSANLNSTEFSNYWSQYDLHNVSGGAQTFLSVYGTQVDSAIASNTVLWHGGTGMFDFVALHCYASNPDTFANSTPSNNPALQFIQWMLAVDSTIGILVTECGGQCQQRGDLCLNLTPCFGDSACAGSSLASYELNVSNLNAQAISSGGFGGNVRAVYGYILDVSNADANRNGQYAINSVFLGGYQQRTFP